MKITNETSVKELKMLADEKGIEYNKNATAQQMKELLGTENVISNNTSQDVSALLQRLNELESLVKATGDSNKIRDFEKEKQEFNNFSFSFKLYPAEDGKLYPVIKWKTVTNQVRLLEAKIETSQIIEITYLQDGKEVNKQIDILDFSRRLKRTPKLLAKSILNLDGSKVYISKQINPETKANYYLMKPEGEKVNVVLNYEGQELTILSDYLNA